MGSQTYDLMVDIDDVLIGLGEAIHELAHQHGLHDGVDVWRMWEAWKQYGCDPDAYWEMWTIFANEGGYVKTPPYPEAATALRDLMWEGHRIHLVTARGFMAHAEEIRAWTPEWLEEWALPYNTLTFARDKVAAMGELGVVFDYAIDDSPRNYEALDAAGVKVYLRDQPHNEEWRTLNPFALRRVPNLTEFVYIIDKESA